jgi:hypothetical protein
VKRETLDVFIQAFHVSLTDLLKQDIRSHCKPHPFEAVIENGANVMSGMLQSLCLLFNRGIATSSRMFAELLAMTALGDCL